jgi:pyruvate,water dikinase
VTAIAAYTLPVENVSRADTALVGGKAANLGEMVNAGLPVPPAFVISVRAYQRFREANKLDAKLGDVLSRLNENDPESLQRVSAELRALVEQGTMPEDLEREIRSSLRTLTGRENASAAVAVRSSATAEDTASHSFAGMFESFLNVVGPDDVLIHVRKCWASTFHARVMFYRLKQGTPAEMPVAVIVQAMVESSRSGVMFTVDPGTRDRGRLVMEAAWGLGEVVVLGQVTPDRYVVSKSTGAVIEQSIGTKDFLLERDPETGATRRVDLAGDARRSSRVLSDNDLKALTEIAARIESHYGSAQDVEFAFAGERLFVTQSRPVTTLATAESTASGAGRETASSTEDGVLLVRGLAASPGVATGRARVLASPEAAARLNRGEVLVTRMTSPDWVPFMRIAAAVVTDAGGVTSHAAIVSRELGIPCIVGTGNATARLKDGMLVTADGGRGTVTAGGPGVASRSQPVSEQTAPPAIGTQRIVTATKLYVNLGEPDRASHVAAMDVDGIGLLRAEFMLLSALNRTHPRKLISEGRAEEIVTGLADGLRVFAGAFHPRPVIYRAMDFRTNEFRGLDGGAAFEPTEENPMIGYRGCYRYIREPDLFALELRAIATVRREFNNVHLMIPFVRTRWEFAECKRLIDESTLASERDLQLWVMAEVPSVAYWLPEYVRLGVTGVSIGSNDLTQLVLGVDRDGEKVAELFDERDGAVLDAVRRIIDVSHSLGVTVSICGQAPSVHPEYAAQLVRWGIDSVSVNPDAIDRTRRSIAEAERFLLLQAARDRLSKRGRAGSND